MTIRNRVTSPQFSHYWSFTNADHSIDVNHALSLTKTGGVEAFAELDGLDVSDCQGQSITIAASITSVSSDPHQCGNGIIWLMYSTGQTANLSTASPDGLIQTGRQVFTGTVRRCDNPQYEALRSGGGRENRQMVEANHVQNRGVSADALRAGDRRHTDRLHGRRHYANIGQQLAAHPARGDVR